MSDEESTRRDSLAEITAQICRAAASASDATLLDAVAQTNARVGIDYNEHGVAMTYLPLAEHFADVGKLRDALDRHALEARAAAVWLLARIDPALLLPHWRAILSLSKRGFNAMSWAGAVAQAATYAWYSMIPLLPEGELGEMFLRGESALRGVSDDALARLPMPRIVAAIRDRTAAGLDHEDAKRLAGHPELASVEDQAKVLGELLALPTTLSSRYALISMLIPQLGASGDARALPVLLVASRDEDQRYRDSADSALIAMRHMPSLERIGRGVAEAAAKGDLKWDPYHVAQGLQRPIQAVYAVDPSTAVGRFAPYLTDEALTMEPNAKLVRDVLAIGGGVLVSHHDVRIGSGNATWLDADPRWREVCTRLATHDHLGPTVWPLLKAWGMPVPAPPKKKKATKAVPKKKATDEKTAPAKKKGARRKP